MAYNFMDYLSESTFDEISSNSLQIDEWKFEISTKVKVFSREFYKLGNVIVCDLTDFLNSCCFEVFQNDEGTVSIRYDDKHLGAKKWLQDFKIIFGLKNNENVHGVKEGILINAEKCIEILNKLISTNMDVVNKLNSLCSKHKGTEKESTYIFLRNQEEKNLKARRSLLAFIRNKIDSLKLKESENSPICVENINEDKIKAKGFEVDVIHFNTRDVKSAVNLSDMLDRIGFDKAITEYPLIWLKRSANFNVKLGNNVYVDPLIGTVWIDIDLALEILTYVASSSNLSDFSLRKIEHMKMFLKKHYSPNNPRKILEDEAPTNAFLKLEQDLQQLSY